MVLEQQVSLRPVWELWQTQVLEQLTKQVWQERSSSQLLSWLLRPQLEQGEEQLSSELWLMLAWALLQRSVWRRQAS